MHILGGRGRRLGAVGMVTQPLRMQFKSYLNGIIFLAFTTNPNKIVGENYTHLQA